MNDIQLASTSTIRKRVYAQFALDIPQVDGYVAAINRIRLASFLQRANEYGKQVGAKPITTIDPDVAKKLLADSRKVATDIVNNHNEDLLAKLISLQRSNRGISQRELAAQAREWRNSRADWKSEQIANTEGIQARRMADSEIAKRNDISTEARADPQTASEPRCSSLVDRGWMSLQDAEQALAEATHPNCVHSLVFRQSFGELTQGKQSIWLGTTINASDLTPVD